MDKKNAIILTVIAVATLLVAMVGATFAYFTAQTGTGASSNVTVTTSTSDSFEYGSIDPLVINATQQNFGQGMGNLSDTGAGSITLKANADTAVTYCYTAALNITANDFEYTVDESTPELLFSISKNSTPIFTDEDITTRSTLLNIPTAAGGNTLIHSISATAGSTVSDSWSATLTLVNLDSDQQANTGKSFVGTLRFETTDCE